MEMRPPLRQNFVIDLVLLLNWPPTSKKKRKQGYCKLHRNWFVVCHLTLGSLDALAIYPLCVRVGRNMVVRLMRKKMERFLFMSNTYMCFSRSRFSSSQNSFPIQPLRPSYGPLAATYCQIEHTLPDSTRQTNEPVCTGGLVGRLCACHTLVRKGFLKCVQEKHPSHSWNTIAHSFLFPPVSNQPASKATYLYFKSFQHFI